MTKDDMQSRNQVHASRNVGNDPQLGSLRTTRRAIMTSAAATGAALIFAPTHDRYVSAQTAGGFSLVETSVSDIRAALDARNVTVREIVQASLDRIAAFDQQGPTLRAVIETNPDALTIADELDAELQAGTIRGPLHGIPILLKDNIATSDDMETTAGSFAMVGSKPVKDSFVAARLREAGLVILGKTNLSEWANIRSVWASSGWSGRGGQAVNPYQLDRTASGSSSGSAIAVAASYVPLAIGTETNGSLVSPAGNCGVVAIKPTVGLVSRQGVIPISRNQDTVGPMARTVTEAAALLNVLATVDQDDPANMPHILADIASPEASPAATPETGSPSVLMTGIPTYPVRPADMPETIDYTDPAILGVDGLRGARIGVLRAGTGFSVGADEIFEAALQTMRVLGAELVDPVSMPSYDELGSSPDGLNVLLWDLKTDLAEYIDGYASPDFPIRSLGDVIAFNEDHADQELQWFDQGLFLMSQEATGTDDPEYLAAVVRNQERGRVNGIDAVLQMYDLDAIVAPTNGPATRIDLVNGDHWLGGTSTPAAAAGYPLVSVPAGQKFGLPIGITFMGGAFSEATLIRFAFAFEQQAQARSAPTYAVAGIDPPAGPGTGSPEPAPDASPVASPAS